MAQAQAFRKTFAERLNFLFDAVRHPSGQEYNISEVAEIINERGYEISRGYISALKEGKKSTPSRECVEALASFFGVPVAYFYDDDIQRWVEQEIRAVAALRNSPVREISLQAFGLSDGSLRILQDAIRHLRRLEGLPESGEDPAPKRRRRWGRRDDSSRTDETGEGPATGR